MKKILKQIYCKLFGHKYVVEKYYDTNVQKLNCTRCNKKFGINHSVQTILEWDADLENTMQIIYPVKL